MNFKVPDEGRGSRPAARRSQAERSEATRAALIESARPLFAERGYAAVGTEEIVRAAGVDFAQGWLYGKPADKPAPALRPSAPVKAVARRAGAAESWG
jgi:EAL domain-containing protein (putative c-di-GMP-specific phosphodiesterase class I)